MHIGLIAYGTRGDVQPLLALGCGLQRAGYTVSVLAGSNFEAWIRSYGLGFANMGVDVQALMQSPDGIRWVESPGWEQPRHMRKLFKQASEPTMQNIWAFSGTVDVLVSSFTSDGLAVAAAEKRGIRWFSVGLQPLRPTRAGHAVFMAPLPTRASALNRGMSAMSEIAMWVTFGDIYNTFRRQLGLPQHGIAEYKRATYNAPLYYGFSPHVMPRPVDYKPHWHVTGYWFLDEPDWQPPPDLTTFLAAGPAPVYIGFGSATDRNAQATSALILRAVKLSGQRALISGGWAGLKQTGHDAAVMFIGGMPHSWLFEHVSAVVHHGGSGTTGSGVRAGVPSMLIPHFAEQPQWARRLHELGVSPAPVPKSKLTAEALAAGLRQMASDTSMRARAAALGEKVRAEDGVAQAVTLIQQHLNEHNP